MEPPDSSCVLGLGSFLPDVVSPAPTKHQQTNTASVNLLSLIAYASSLTSCQKSIFGATTLVKISTCLHTVIQAPSTQALEWERDGCSRLQNAEQNALAFLLTNALPRADPATPSDETQGIL